MGRNLHLACFSPQMVHERIVQEEEKKYLTEITALKRELEELKQNRNALRRPENIDLGKGLPPS